MTVDFTNEPQLGKKLLNRELNTEGTPLISIITLHCNAEECFEQTFNCVMNQSFPWFEWIIVNNDDTDEEDIMRMKKFADTDSRVHIHHRVRTTFPSIIQFAIDKTSTEIIVQLDPDDLIEPTFLETMFFCLYFNSDATLAYTNQYYFQPKSHVCKDNHISYRIKEHLGLIRTVAIRKSALIKMKKYTANFQGSNANWGSLLQFITKDSQLIHADYFGVWHRVNGLLPENYDEKKHVDFHKEPPVNHIDAKIMVKDYPTVKTGLFRKPTSSMFERKLFKKHSKVNIMLLIPWMEMGGADLFNLNIAKKIDRERFEVSMLTTSYSKNSWRKYFEEYITDVFELPSFLDEENYPEFISYFIRMREVDVVFLSNSYYGYYLTPWLRKEFPRLAIVDYVHMEEWYWRNGGYGRISGALGDILDKTYVCNERTRQILINCYNRKPENVETVYIGVDQDKYCPDKTISGQAKRMLGISQERKVVLFPCRLHPQKRPFLMIEIAKKLKEKLPSIAFVVVGDGPQLNELKSKVRQEKMKNTVYFADRQENMTIFYKDSDVVLICSLKEGLALTAYEGLAMGVPVVSSDVGGQKELIDSSVGKILPLMQNEEKHLDVRTFSDEEITQYADALYEILVDEISYPKLSENCTNRIKNGFSIDTMVKRFETEFQNLLERKNWKNRENKAENIKKFEHLIEEYVTLYVEYDSLEKSLKNSQGLEIKNELMRIANSNIGKKLIHLLFKLRINKLFK